MFVDKLVLGAKDELALVSEQTEVEACGVRDLEMGDFEVEILLVRELGGWGTSPRGEGT